MKLTLVTSNIHKAREVAASFGEMCEIGHVALEIPELRSDDVCEIARGKAIFAFDELRIPVIVDDTGFFIDALEGFPGPYAAYVMKTIGNGGILRLMEEEKDRNAHFITAIAYADSQGVRIFSGTINGRITHAPRGSGGFGYDPIFETGGKTLAELSLEEKSRVSHRAIALASFRDWITDPCQRDRR